ncbi:MAG: SPOR domain-containing protein [Rhodocyclaceae bacterium]|nr:SPOR domain-containing protein [Rhodocyclaceae bacterium]
MPTANPPELSAAELELKRRGRRRLIGALTIGLLAIVVLPMIFDSEPRKKQAVRQEIEVQIPPKEGLPPLPPPAAPAASLVEASPKGVGDTIGKVDVKGSPVAVTAAAGAATAKVSAAEPDKSGKPKPEVVAALPAKSAPAKSDAKQVAPPPAVAAVPPPDSAKAPSTTAAATGFVIQLGAYRDADNAKALVARMKEVKLPVFTDELPVKSGTVTRVRVGPFPTKEIADGALVQVKLAGVDGRVVPLP